MSIFQPSSSCEQLNLPVKIFRSLFHPNLIQIFIPPKFNLDLMSTIVDLDSKDPIDLQAIQGTPYLTNIVFQITIDSQLEDKLAKISVLVPFLSQNPTIKSRLRVAAVESNPLKQYRVGAVGGTFDCLHIGHQVLLLYAALSAQQTVYVGITADSLLSHKKYRELIQHVVVRMQNVLEFMRSVNPSVQLVGYELTDPFGSTTAQQRVQFVTFSPEPGDNLVEINEQRRKQGFVQLEVVRCPLLTPLEKYDQKFSSTYIRKELLQRNNLNLDQLGQYKVYFYHLIELSKQLGYNDQNYKKTAQIWWDHLFFSYSQRWRYYHTNSHIYQIIRRWNSAQFEQHRHNLTTKATLILQIALFFHDVVYRPGSQTNQKESAQVAQRFVRQCLQKQGQGQEIVAEIKRLILQTQKHSKPASQLSQIVYDLDMGVLNDPHLYKSYAEGIRKEYEPLLKQQYPQKRSEFLRKTLKQGLYFSYAATNVQQNMKWQLQYLQQFRS